MPIFRAIEFRPNDLARAHLRYGLMTFPKSRIEDGLRQRAASLHTYLRERAV
jgi:hypothetical protein